MLHIGDINLLQKWWVVMVMLKLEVQANCSAIFVLCC